MRGLIRKFALLAALFGATYLGGCQATAIKANDEAKKIPEQPVESSVIQKGEPGYVILQEKFKIKTDALPADKKDPNYELDAKIARAYIEKTGVKRFQAGDEELFTEPFGPEDVLMLAREDIQQHIAAYDNFIKEVFKDSMITPEERDHIVAYVNSTVNNIRSIENSGAVSQITLVNLLKELNAVLDFYGNNTSKDFFLGIGLVGGRDFGLTGNPQKIELTEQKMKEMLGESVYNKLVAQAKANGLSKYTPIPPKGDYGREEELETARGQWTEITKEDAAKLVAAGNLGAGSMARLNPDRWAGFTDGKFENSELAPGATYVQAATTGAKASENVMKDALYGKDTVKEKYD